MRVAPLLLVSILALIPTTALAQENQPSYKLNIANRQQVEYGGLLQLRIYQQVRRFNAEVEQALSQTRANNEFSRPYLDEFQRRNDQIQHDPDKTIIIRGR